LYSHLLEPSGPLQDCNGIALPLPLLRHKIDYSMLTFRHRASYM
jgi:hypothetical protein